ncbi:MAG: rod shape-determining protein MreD [Clostridiales bacterium]|jgi:rod shape-determining protein MreD|nr:rod shape-determining protein MreD [Clostridiales bacterium]
MSFLIIFGLFVISLSLQGSVLALAGTSGVHPDFLLVVVIALALLSDSKRGAIIGLCAGLMQDILFGSPLGFFAFVKMLIGALAGLLADEIYKDFILAPMMLVAAFTLISEIITFYLMQFYFSPPISLLHYLQQFSLFRIGMHITIIALVYPYLYRAQKRHLLFFEPGGE